MTSALRPLLLAAVLAHPQSAAACPAKQVTSDYARRVERALFAKRDVWGEALIRSAAGPTYDAVRRHLTPLLLVGRPAGTGGQRLTDSGVYYLAFGQPRGPAGRGPVALHVADGGQIVWNRADGPKLALDLGRERYGSCLARLATPNLAGGWLPILETRYVDARGIRYRQESFAAGEPLASFVRLTVDTRRAPGVQLRFAPSRGAPLVVPVAAGVLRTIYVRVAATKRELTDQATYDQAREGLIAYWQRRLAEGTTYVVPERRVVDAERNLLLQNLVMTWRYSVGNDYETFEFPESLDTAEVMGEYGFQAVDRAVVETSLRREPRLYPSWEAGERLLASALYYRLFRDDPFLERAMPALRRQQLLLTRLGAHGLLPKERYASDLPEHAYGITQAVAWQGLRGIAQAWADAGRAGPAAAARAAAARLEPGLRAALRASSRRLRDGSLFVPARLLGDETPYDALTSSRAGSYWNLVLPHALASGLIRPRSAEARGVLRYLALHGSRLLGLVRFDYQPGQAGGAPGYTSSGSDDVYELNLVRFLADNDQPDELVLSLYGQLAAGMTEGTFVSGEGATIAPVAGAYYRSMYLPPNSTSNAAFLETLRLMLVHETPRGLELAYATPRAWLAPGKRIAVDKAPTGFGQVSYTIESTPGAVRVQLQAPVVRELRLRLRLPRGRRIAHVLLDGKAYRRFDRASGTIDLSGHSGPLTLEAR